MKKDFTVFLQSYLSAAKALLSSEPVEEYLSDWILIMEMPESIYAEFTATLQRTLMVLWGLMSSSRRVMVLRLLK